VHALAAKRGIARTALLASVMLAAAGCDSLRMNEGRVTSVFAAAQVGAFKREKGKWPTGLPELIAQGCPALDQDPEFLIDESLPLVDGCQFFVKLPYQLELRPRAGDLQIELRNSKGKLVCRLVVVVPVESAHALIPQVKLRTTLFACPGEGKSL
jgi:hypothetical protein